MASRVTLFHCIANSFEATSAIAGKSATRVWQRFKESPSSRPRDTRMARISGACAVSVHEKRATKDTLSGLTTASSDASVNAGGVRSTVNGTS